MSVACEQLVEQLEAGGIDFVDAGEQALLDFDDGGGAGVGAT
jgi:hypothetical protein